MKLATSILLTLGCLSAGAAEAHAPATGTTTLQAVAFRPYPIKAIKPGGWLAKQLKIQADGMSGHLDEFWPDLKDSRWIGGTGTQNDWERMPYWLDGVIPLAWQLDDAPLKARITGYIDQIIKRQGKDGWIGPRPEEHNNYNDRWVQLLLLKLLTVYYDASGDARVPAVVEKSLRCFARSFKEGKDLSGWGQDRGFEGLIAVYWLYERTKEPWLLDLAEQLRQHTLDWQKTFSHWAHTGRTPTGKWNREGHVVNNAMAIKAGALYWRLSGKEADRQFVYEMMGKLDQCHGMPTGVFSGDECLAGLSAIQGTELCSVVEYMYTLECLISILGDPLLADRLERIAYNALPATISKNMWSHQYDQQVNQIECSVRTNRSWTTNAGDSNIFGLEPSFGCCTANFSQGWPKFAAHLWMQTADGGIAAVAYAPSRLVTQIGTVPVSVELETGYPFRDELRFTVSVAQAVDFPLLLRIPQWAKQATLEMDGKSQRIEAPGSFYRIQRRWQGKVVLTLKLPMNPEALPRPNGALSIARGPLVYGLKIGEDWKLLKTKEPNRELPHADWEVYPTTSWNYALATSGKTLAGDICFKERPLGEKVFSPEGAPVVATIKARRVSEWREENGSAQPTPASPVATAEPNEQVTLIPYGCTSLRIAEFPLAGSQAAGKSAGAKTRGEKP